MRKRTMAIMAFMASLLIALVAAGPAFAKMYTDSYGSVWIGNGNKAGSGHLYQSWTTDGTASTTVPTITLSRTDYGRFNRWCNGTTFSVPINNGDYQGSGVCYGGGSWHASLIAYVGTIINGVFAYGAPTVDGVNETGAPIYVTITVTK